MTSTGGDGYQSQARAAADGGDAGPTIGPKRGPTDRRDVVIAVAAIAVVAVIVVLLVV